MSVSCPPPFTRCRARAQVERVLRTAGWTARSFLPRDAMRKRGLCCRPVSVCPSRWCWSKIWRRWASAPGRGRGWPLERHPSPRALGRSRSKCTSVIKEIGRKNMVPRFRPFKVTQGHQNRQGSIGYLWLIVIHSKITGLSRTASEINDDFGGNSQFFTHPVYLMSTLRRFPLEFCNGDGA